MLLDQSISIEELVCKVIPVFEAFSSRAYYDKLAGKWTIGYGHSKGVDKSQTITKAEAQALMINDCHELFLLVKNRPLLEAVMLIDFGYNCGAAALRRLLAGSITFQNYGRMSGGTYVDGLIKRREFEECMIRLSRSIHRADT